MPCHTVARAALAAIAPLFYDNQETMILSCLQGHMGSAWADDAAFPHAAQIIVGDFCFFAGEPARDLIKNIPADFSSPALIMTPPDETWAALIEESYPGRYEKSVRCAFLNDCSKFDRVKLQEYARSLPAPYQIRRIDAPLFERARSAPWSADLCSQFADYRAFERKGLGFVATCQGELCCGASSYTVFDGGIEIEIDTHERHRRRGLARACAATLILECLSRGLTPSWDAANPQSAALAKTLGYRPAGEYPVYLVAVSPGGAAADSL